MTIAIRPRTITLPAYSTCKATYFEHVVQLHREMVEHETGVRPSLREARREIRRQQASGLCPKSDPMIPVPEWGPEEWADYYWWLEDLA